MTLGVLGAKQPARVGPYRYAAAGSIGAAHIAVYPYSAEGGLGVIDHWCWNIPAVKTCHDTKAVPYAQQQCAAAGDSSKACIDGHAESYLRKNCGCPATDPAKKPKPSSTSPTYVPPSSSTELPGTEPTILGFSQSTVLLVAALGGAYWYLTKDKKKG